MRGKKSVLTTVLAALVLALVLAPAAHLMEKNLPDEGQKDAEHLVEPMLRMLADSPLELANASVEPVMDIEDAWNIEDTRQEAYDSPLVTGMRNGVDELGYDRESRTFYCTVGLSEEGDWPGLALFAQGYDGCGDLRAAWIDDYSYDFRSDAVAMGYRYEFIAYTDTQYEYVGVVFTGLPIVTLETETEIGETYIPARVGVYGEGYDAVNSGALVHTRGGGYKKSIDKFSYRVEFHEQRGGQDKKAARSVLGMEADTDWLLISNASDETGMRNHLCWEFWRMWNPQGNAPVLLESRMVELFLGDTYMGMYQLMERIREEEELIAMGGNPETDYLYRIIREMGIDSRPVEMKDNRWYELRLKPDPVREKRQFDQIENYVLLNNSEFALGDDGFDALALECVDIPALMNYYAFSQAADLGYENVDNNVYIWALKNEDGRYVYHLSPWDMDNALPAGQGKPEEITGLNLMMRMPFEMLNRNVGGCREMYWEIWMDKRQGMLADDALYQFFEYWEQTINRSGAYARETEKWWGGARDLSLQHISANMIQSMHDMERQARELWPTAQYYPE